MRNILKMVFSRLPNCVTHKNTGGQHTSLAAIRGITSYEQSTLRTFMVFWVMTLCSQGCGYYFRESYCLQCYSMALTMKIISDDNLMSDTELVA